MKRVLIDSDILFDIISDNDNCDESLKLINNLDIENVDAYISAFTVFEICKDLEKEKIIQISRVLEIVFNIIDLRMSDIKKALYYDSFKNGIIMNQAKRTRIDYIITRNVNKYSNDKIKVLYPKQLKCELNNDKKIEQKRNI